jgi:hypothetical protein
LFGSFVTFESFGSFVAFGSFGSFVAFGSFGSFFVNGSNDRERLERSKRSNDSNV